MPMLEVIMTGLDDVSSDAKREFAAEVAEVLLEVMGTPRSRIQLVLRDVAEGDCADGLFGETGDGPATR